MIPALLLALAAAVLNATWNVLLKTSADPLRTATRAVTLATLLATPFAAAAWILAGHPMPSVEAAGLAALSGLVELAYFICLSAAYRRGELSAVYPLARGTAPLLAVLAALFVLREHLRSITLVGVLLLLAGIWVVRRPSPRSSAVAPALLTGVCIATYSSLDSVGANLLAPWLYGWLLWACTASWLLAWALVRRVAEARHTPDAGEAPEAEPPGLARTLGIGIVMTTGYYLVLLALRLAPLAVVAPLRESSIVLVTGWGIWRLDEREGRWTRMIGAGAIVCGAVLLAI